MSFRQKYNFKCFPHVLIYHPLPLHKETKKLFPSFHLLPHKSQTPKTLTLINSSFVLYVWADVSERPLIGSNRFLVFRTSRTVFVWIQLILTNNVCDCVWEEIFLWRPTNVAEFCISSRFQETSLLYFDFSGSLFTVH